MIKLFFLLLGLSLSLVVPPFVTKPITSSSIVGLQNIQPTYTSPISPTPVKHIQSPSPNPIPSPALSLKPNSPTATTNKPQGMRETILLLLNTERNIRGLVPFRENSLLNNSAAKKAHDLLVKNYWSHTSPEGKEFWTFIEDVGYNYTEAGENLAKGYFDSQSVIDNWMQNEGHRNNILNGNYSEIGISVIDGFFEGYQTKLVIAHFAKST